MKTVTYRCQVCDGFGQLQSISTRSSDSTSTHVDGEYANNSNDWKRIKRRLIECRECGNTWRS